ncbi:MAG: polyprenyl synthetase family protein [Bacilli bacterium]
MNVRWMKTHLIQSIKEVDQLLLQSIKSDVPMLQKACEQLVHSGGKRIRPLLVIVSSAYGKCTARNVLHVAAALELIHMASLVHDDVIDEAHLRRGEPTINATHDNCSAMYVGDYLFARGISLLSDCNDIELHKMLSDTIHEVCLGEIDQIKHKYDWNQSLVTYFRRMKRKTAILIAASCAMGAKSTGADEKIVALLYRYGYYIGMSFQIKDDLLDFTASEAQMGKPVASDLRAGHLTYPAFLARKDSALWTRIQNVNPQSSDDEMKEIIKEMKRLEIFKQVENKSERYLRKAIAITELLPKCKETDVLKDIAHQMNRRKK